MPNRYNTPCWFPHYVNSRNVRCAEPDIIEVWQREAEQQAALAQAIASVTSES